MKTYWLTKYALSKGITAELGELLAGHKTSLKVADYYGYFHLGKDAFETEQEAKTVAEVMRTKKIASLKKSIAKLEQMEFK